MLCVADSEDGRHIVSGDYSGYIRVWSTTTLQMVYQSMLDGEPEIRCVAFAPNNQRIAAGSIDEMVRVCDAKTGQMIGKPYEGHESPVTSVLFLRDGIRMVALKTSGRAGTRETGNMNMMSVSRPETQCANVP